MAIDRPTPSAKRGRAVPVRVKIDPRPAPTIHPPLPAAELPPVAPTNRTVKNPAPPKPFAPVKQAIATARPLKVLKQPVHEWSEAKRRKLMWWLVGGGTCVVIIGWLAVVRFEMGGGQGPDLFGDTMRLLKTIKWPGTKQPTTPAEQEIRNLDQQVFPKFTQ